MKELAFEIIGDILIIREEMDEVSMTNFAKDKIQKHPFIKSVFLQISKIQGQERKRDLKHIMGEDKAETIHKEYGNSYLLDISEVFFSPRLSFERQRIANLTNGDEIILNFFAGVGPFSIAIASKCNSCVIHSIEMNKIAYDYLVKNIHLNKCQRKVIPYFGDAFEIVPQKFKNRVSRVLLPLPLDSDKALPIAHKSLRNGLGVIHWQITEKIHMKKIDEDIIINRIENIPYFSDMSIDYSITELRLIRWLGPKIAHIAADLGFKSP
jgi:tRNA (guanine37-N1)-methyltransferase